MKRGGGLRRTQLQRHAPAARDPAEVLLAAGWRDAVWVAGRGRCVMTGVRVPRGGDSWTWHGHHVVQKQRLSDTYRWNPDCGVILTRRAHERHHSRTEVVPLERLPAAALTIATEMGWSFVCALLREHPPAEQLNARLRALLDMPDHTE